MLSSYSWVEFLQAISLILAVYYIIVVLLLHGRDIKAKLIAKKREESEKDFDEQSAPYSASAIIGQIKDEPPYPIPHLQQTVSTEEVNVTVTGSSIGERDMLQEVNELLDQFKSLITSLIEDDASNEECIFLVRKLLEDFPKVNESNYKQSVNLFLHQNLQKLPLGLKLEDIEALWPDASNQSIK